MIGNKKGLEIIFQKCSLIIFLDEVTEDSIKEDNMTMQDIDIKKEHYDCPHCGQVFFTIAEVEGHVMFNHEDITRQIVRCSECQKVLPNDETAIKHHMINEHIKAKQQIIAIGGGPKKMKMDFRSKSTPNIKTNPELAKYMIDPDKKSYACTYCGERFQMRTDRAAHEKENHVDKDGNFLEITCDLCQEKLATPDHYRRHCIDKHKKHNRTLVKKEKTFCCDECGKTFKVS